MKKIISLMLVLALLGSALPFALADDAAGPQTMTTASQLVSFLMDHSSGAISLAPAVIDRGNGPEEVWLFMLQGTVYFFSGYEHYNNLAASILSGLSVSTRYLRAVKQTARDLIPKGSKIVFVGHSLGGMISQQFAADPEMKARYEIINILGAGSPFVPLALGREGTLHRIGDYSDPIPYITPAIIRNLFLHIGREGGGFSVNMRQAHMTSYLRDDVWGAYDVFGVKGGSVTISCDPANVIFADVLYFNRLI